jgi:hypothetical protein
MVRPCNDQEDTYPRKIGSLLLLVANLCWRREPHEACPLLSVLVVAEFADDAHPCLVVRGFQENRIAKSALELSHLGTDNLGIIRFALPLL